MQARIEAAGGQVIKDRLHGVLAVSRAFGDGEHKRAMGEVWPLLGLFNRVVSNLLLLLLLQECWGRQFTADPLTAEPEILHEPLQPGLDEFFVLACDGVWDVMTSQQARVAW